MIGLRFAACLVLDGSTDGHYVQGIVSVKYTLVVPLYHRWLATDAIGTRLVREQRDTSKPKQ